MDDYYNTEDLVRGFELDDAREDQYLDDSLDDVPDYGEPDYDELED